MTNTIINTSYEDSFGRKLLWDNNVRNVYSYVSSNESWDRTGGGTLSWAVENSQPSDTFYGSSLDTSKWSFFNYRGTISGSVSDKLVLDIINSEARGGVTSEGIWSLSGDFDVKLYVDESSYYNEYRSETATGLTVSISDSYKYRISKYFDGSSIGYMAHNLDGEEEKFLGWFDNGILNTTAGESGTTCLRIKRVGDEIYSYVSSSSGFVTVGSGVSGSSWTGAASIEVEAQTVQYNTYKMDVVGISVSGTLSDTKTFSSPLRGDQDSFPSSSIILVDDLGLSIVDEDDMSLWMRFVNSPDYMFKSIDTDISASDGSVYYTTSSGLVGLDFVNDKAVWFVEGEKRETEVGISGRNFNAPVYSVGSSSLVIDNDVLAVSSKKINSDSFVAVGTASGIGLLINGAQELTGPAGNVKSVSISPSGNMYWNDYSDSSGQGKLYYRSSVQNLVGLPDSTFSATGYYTSSSSPISVSSEEVNDISIADVGTEAFVAAGHSCGIDYIANGTKIFYGPVNIINPFQDYSFSGYLGTSWSKYSSVLFQSFDVITQSSWYTDGATSLRISLKDGTSEDAMVVSGSFGGVYQQVDVTLVDKIYFDYKLESSSTTNLVDLEIAVDGTVLKTVSDTTGSHVSYNNVVSVHDFTGLVTFEIRLKSKYTGSCDNSNIFFIDNLRAVQQPPDYSIIPSAAQSVLEVLLFYSVSEKKIFFCTSDGYGAIDIPSNSLDFFTEVGVYVPLSSVLSAEYVEYIDAV